jgi:hypothetical protein
LERRLLEQLRLAFGSIPGDVAGVLAEERRRVLELAAEVGKVAEWLGKREQAASIAGLYGN